MIDVIIQQLNANQCKIYIPGIQTDLLSLKYYPSNKITQKKLGKKKLGS